MSDERVSQLIGEASQSTDSVGEILRTDGRTHGDSYSPIDQSLTSVPRARVRREVELEALYRIFDAAGQLLYIGRTREWPRRMRQHEQGKPWWRDVAHIDVEWVPADEMALAEMQAIASEHPRYNITANRLVDRINEQDPYAGPYVGLNCVVCKQAIPQGRIFFYFKPLGTLCSPCTEEHNVYADIVIPPRLSGAVA